MVSRTAAAIKVARSSAAEDAPVQLDDLALQLIGLGRSPSCHRIAGEVAHRREAVGVLLAVFADHRRNHRLQQLAGGSEIALGGDASRRDC